MTVPLQKPWTDLDRDAVAKAPDRPGVYELGDADGTVRSVGHGVLRDELKTALSYGDGDRVRWTETHTLERARELAEEHRERLE
ncbi:hypothetical protein SAMN05444422_104168 [Halobiforma haloterrestris]|uniref:DUF7508 domain-containing protein n=1 Tax=Natronobacterium haloterrestre TaxID=148448 RepID=A0A1I1G9C8_NATHA|nr:hypothetical protein SAMN05444422_104168 [Halobiforma haloterrestris]